MHAQAAKVCLKLLNDPCNWNKRHYELPLDWGDILRYASLNWGKHLQQCDESDVDARLMTLLKQFLGSMNESSSAYRSSYENLVQIFLSSCHHLPGRAMQLSLLALIVSYQIGGNQALMTKRKESTR